MKMKCLYIFFVFLLLGKNQFAQSTELQSYHVVFYKNLNHGNIEMIEMQLNSMQDLPSKDTLAYSGALRMKLSGMLSGTSLKLSLFKDGKKRLEQAIAEDSTKAEYRFLRLIIQENAPSILRYNNKLTEDKNFILLHFSSLNPVLKSEIKKYSATSKILQDTF